MDFQRNKKNLFLIVCAIISSLLSACQASFGDNSHPYRKCLKVCLSSRCNNPSGHERFLASQPFHLRLLGWDCIAECKYDCMWEAVDFFIKKDVDVPQFHGKWPFVRWMGMQEPASALASLLNGLSHLFMLRRFQRLIPSSAPFFHLWRFFAFVCINAWFWSFVFHLRDNEWTERFDYFSAFSLILVQLFCCLVRIVGVTPVRKPMTIGFVLGVVFLHHCVSMSWVKFDYGYNMKVNVFFAAVNVVVWAVFCGRMMLKGYAYYWRALASLVWFSSSALLETLDFPPLWWSLDSHALWHLSTVPLPYLFYNFVVEDCRALLKGEERSVKTSYHFELDVEDQSPMTTTTTSTTKSAEEMRKGE